VPYSTRQINELKTDPVLLKMVQDRVPSLDQVGAEFKGLCPFHQEDTPSYLFHCFGCGANGNLIQLIQKKDNITFEQACEKVISEKKLEPRKTKCRERIQTHQRRKRAGHVST